jgi:hypothetical protein
MISLDSTLVAKIAKYEEALRTGVPIIPKPSTNAKEGVSELFDSTPELASIGTPQQYSAYLDTIFPDSKVKDIVYRGGVKADVKLFQYWTNNRAEAYMYAKANIFKGGKITERNPIEVIVNNYKSYINNKYGTNTFESLNLDETDYLTQVSETEYELRLPSWYKKNIQIDSSDKADFDAINTLKSTYDLIKIEDEQDLDKPYTVNNYASLKKDYDQARKQLDKYFKIEDLGEIKTAILNIKNPYKEEIRQEDLQDDRDAYKNGYDGAFLADGDHFLVKSNTEQIHILGNQKDIAGFKKFVNAATTQPSTKASDQNNMNEFVNHSGGALGADTAWDTIGKEFGMINNQHYWMNNKTPKGNVEITKEDSVEGQQKVTSAARNMGRIEPNQQVRDERLIRNWSQVKYSDAVFAVTTMLSVGGEMNYGKVAKIRQGKGGTGYAIQMAIEAGKPVYVFDQTRKQWFKNINGTWSTSDVPTLTKNFAGIGTREINETGLQAIRDTYAATVSALTTAQTNLDEQMYSPNEGTITPITSKIVTLPITDKGPSNIDNKLNDQLGGKNNLDDLGFEEVSCDIPQ